MQQFRRKIVDNVDKRMDAVDKDDIQYKALGRRYRQREGAKQQIEDVKKMEQKEPGDQGAVELGKPAEK